MSYEGYHVFICEHGHIFMEDVHDSIITSDFDGTCFTEGCNSKIDFKTFGSVDETNPEKEANFHIVHKKDGTVEIQHTDWYEISVVEDTIIKE